MHFLPPCGVVYSTTEGDVRDPTRALLFSICALAFAACVDGERDLFGPDWHTTGSTASEVSFETVSAGYAHTCGLAEGGIAYCWGSNVGGAVGDGTTTDRLVPTEVTGGLRFSSIGVGENHTCALTTDGAAYCWGVDPLTLLGGGPLSFDSLPQAVPGGRQLESLAVGTHHTCALDADGAAWCWGLNRNGQLGDSTSMGRDEPTRVRGGHLFRALAAGEATCGIELDGTVYCWGRNPSDCQCTFVPQVAAAGYAFNTVTVAGHACGLDEAGVAFCWGENISGQIGDGSNTNRPDPTAVLGDLRFSDISAGRFGTCALEEDGDAFCWGSNPSGFLGNGTSNTQSDGPTAVLGGMRFRSISAGSNHTCAIDESGELWCWGWNFFGQLGDGTTEDKHVPGAVLRPRPAAT